MNLLGQDLLRQMDVIITTDHLASYDDKTEQGVIRLTLGFTPKSRGHCPQGLSLGRHLVKLVWVEQWPLPELKHKMLKEISRNLHKKEG